ncbi:MFS general substrate transporter [Lentithecium fluviatile CBS 122367]|uniref:MFS general substrate transporter n=1 Tax=Lentithecium fluviatile CBS 122367 TaxID=1168545 RepID=A0A6G1J4S3_9PLEO|nr:MFS general substrate transporter [Lentithecium fluviatile CBS 122367]
MPFSIKDVERGLKVTDRRADQHGVDNTTSPAITHKEEEELSGDRTNDFREKEKHLDDEEPRCNANEHDRISNGAEIQRTPTHKSHTSLKPKLAKLTNLALTRSNASIRDPGPPPDGGVKAWTQACMGHLVILNTWGMVATFGVFQTYYTTELGFEPSAVSWIGSMQMLGHFGLGMFTGRALDAGFYYYSLVPGMLLTALGMFMTSLCTHYYQFFLAQGLLTGLGCGCQFTPSMSLISTYFARNRSTALAIMASGSATGGLLYPTIARQLLPAIGFAWTVRVMGFIMLAWSAFHEPAYGLYLLGLFLFCFGIFFAFYYITSFAVNVLGVPYSTSINLLMIMNGVGLLGRLIPGYIADAYLGPYNTLIPLCFLTSIILYCWAAVYSVPSLYAFAILYGFFSAGFQGLFPAVLASLTKDMSKVGTRNGMGFGVVGLASLTGPPIAGALVQSHGGGYLAAQMWGASMMFAGSVVVLLGRLSITGWTLKIKV